MTDARVTLVTGASSGIGRALALRLLEEGHTVLNVSRRPSPEAHDHLQDIALDLTDSEATSRAAEEIAARWPVTRIVHNAGIIRPNLLPEATAEDVRVLTQLHVTSPMLLTQAVLPAMEKAQFGRIVFITSRAALGVPTRTAYSATKAAVHGMLRTWALELGPLGITANAVAPGPILTDNFWGIIDKGSEREAKLADALPVRRLGTVDDVVHAARFFLDDAAGFTTGQVLYVCGGASVGMVTL
ncbi:MAG: SDR family oxidoreductase [Pseudomonadota bacterium]